MANFINGQQISNLGGHQYSSVGRMMIGGLSDEQEKEQAQKVTISQSFSRSIAKSFAASVESVYDIHSTISTQARSTSVAGKVTDAINDIDALTAENIDNSSLDALKAQVTAAKEGIEGIADYQDNHELLSSYKQLTEIEANIATLKDDESYDMIAVAETELSYSIDGTGNDQLQLLLADADTLLAQLATEIAPYSGDGGSGGDGEPDPVHPGDGNIINQVIDDNFDGSTEYVEIAHDTSQMLDSGTIAIDFTADNTSGMQALFSKDSTNYDDGGHVTAYLQGDEVIVRLQSDTASYEVRGGTVTAGEETSIAFSFGENGMELFVNGESVDTSEYTGGLGDTSGGSGNENPWAIGANNWNSGDNVNNNLIHHFDGDIGTFRVYDTQLTEPEAQLLAGVEVTVEEPLAEVTGGNILHVGINDNFDGSNQYEEIAHSADQMLDNGTISVNFTADDTYGKQGILTKDSSNYDDGGHMAMYLEGDEVVVRFQSDTTSYEVRGGSITAGEESRVSFSFGDDGMKLFVDGELVDSDAYTGGMGSTSGGSGNENPWAVGANNWASGDNVNSSLQHHFNGSIGYVDVYDSQLTLEEIDTIGTEIAATPHSLAIAVEAARDSLAEVDSDNVTEKVEETFRRLSNLAGQISLVDPDDDSYATVQGMLDRLETSIDGLADLVNPQLSTGGEKLAGLEDVKMDLSEVLTSLNQVGAAEQDSVSNVTYDRDAIASTIEQTQFKKKDDTDIQKAGLELLALSNESGGYAAKLMVGNSVNGVLRPEVIMEQAEMVKAMVAASENINQTATKRSFSSQVKVANAAAQRPDLLKVERPDEDKKDISDKNSQNGPSEELLRLDIGA